jgi:hypothetical protein
MININYRINFESSHKHKVEKYLQRYSDEISCLLKSIKIAKYWKDESQFQAAFKVQINETTNAEIVYKMLSLAKTLESSLWTVNGPHEQEQLIFECILNNEDDDQPLKWAHLEVEIKT